MDRINYNLAHELAHSYLHYDKGDTIHSERHAEYEEQADRAAEMLLELIKTTGNQNVLHTGGVLFIQIFQRK